MSAANVQVSDAALAATPSRIKCIRPLNLCRSYNAVAASVQVSDANLANVSTAFPTIL